MEKIMDEKSVFLNNFLKKVKSEKKNFKNFKKII